MLLCKTNVYKVKKKCRQITIQKRLARAVCGEVWLASLHRRFLGLILAHTDTAVSIPLFTFDRNTYANEVSGQRALKFSQSQHTGPN